MPDSLAGLVVAHEQPAFSDPRDPLATARAVSDHLHIALGKLRAKLPPGIQVTPAVQDEGTSLALRRPNLPTWRERVLSLITFAASLHAVGEGAASGIQLVLGFLNSDL